MIACCSEKFTSTASTPGAVLMAFSAFGAHVCHVMPSMRITVLSMSDEITSLGVKKLVAAFGKNRNAIAKAVTPQSITLLKAIILDVLDEAGRGR